MARSKRLTNIRHIISRRSYTTGEVADLLRVHRRTIQTWKREGLEPVDSNSKPFLFMGYEIRRFLMERKSNRKIKLKDNEFYCPRCKAGRRSNPANIEIIYTHKVIGKNDEAVRITGICIVCGCKLNRFSTKIRCKSSDFALKGAKRQRALKGDSYNLLNTDIEGDENHEKQYKERKN